MSVEKTRLVRRCDFSDGIARYELATGDNHHHHLVCTGCKRVEDLDLADCPTQKLERSARARGYAEVEHTLEIFGLCPRCQTITMLHSGHGLRPEPALACEDATAP